MVHYYLGILHYDYITTMDSDNWQAKMGRQELQEIWGRQETIEAEEWTRHAAIPFCRQGGRQYHAISTSFARPWPQDVSDPCTVFYL